ncbi:MAG TPA: glycosyltransferase [Pyrinomonadaceae bacterium]|nr:glycosyltransferase [Pyrinomonadaceae bacterium]
MKPRVLQLIDSFDQGGSERQALELSRLLHASGAYEVSLASLKAEGVLRSSVADLGLGEIPSYPLQSFYGLNTVKQLRRFVRHLRVARIEVLHTHDFYTNIFGMAAGFLAGVKVRIASRRETNGMRSDAQLRAQKIAYSLAHHVVANSRSVKETLVAEGVAPEKVSVIYNGLNLERLSGPRNLDAGEALGLKVSVVPENLVTIVANMRHDVKDYPTFLRAAKLINQAVPNTGFLLAGEGELRESIKQLAEELGIGDRTIFLGRCEKIAQLLQVTHVGVLSSKAEGFSNSILEYMAAGRPVVATDVGGAREAIVESETGYLVPVGDAEQMAQRIISLLHDPAKAQLMGKRGRQIVVEQFSAQALLKNTTALYQKLLSRVASKSVDLSTKPKPDALVAG